MDVKSRPTSRPASHSVLANGSWRSDARGTRGRFVDRILLPNLRKVRSRGETQLAG